MTLTAFIAAAALGAIAAIWLGYPAVVWIIVRLRQSALANSAAEHAGDNTRAYQRAVSVVLATRDRAEVVRARLENLLLTDHPAELVQVIVALDADNALSTVAELRDLDARVRVIIGDAPGGKAAALNAGVRAASGEILVFADAQQRYNARTIPELVAALDDPRFGAVSGALQLGGNGKSPVDWYWRMEKWLRHNEAQIHSSVGVTGAVYATRRTLWPVVPVGTLLDDVYVPMSLVLRGYRIGFTYAAQASDVRTFDATNEGLRKTRTLTGVLQLRDLLPDLLSLKANPIAVQFIMHKVLRLLTPVLGAVFVLAFLVLLVQMAFVATPNQLSYALAILALLLILPSTRRRIVALVEWSFSLQLATTRAIMNGIGGRWSVWGKTRS